MVSSRVSRCQSPPTNERSFDEETSIKFKKPKMSDDIILDSDFKSFDYHSTSFSSLLPAGN